MALACLLFDFVSLFVTQKMLSSSSSPRGGSLLGKKSCSLPNYEQSSF